MENFFEKEIKELAKKMGDGWEAAEPIANELERLGCLSANPEGHWTIIGSGEIFCGPMIRGAAFFFARKEGAYKYAVFRNINGVFRLRKIAEEYVVSSSKKRL
ncbi:MAG: hypothetical protein PHC85_00915 [Candidatus Pacebacteria bacterium]|nr:hypothetical protein [Candidatus Paceibacterota bacterium]